MTSFGAGGPMALTEAIGTVALRPEVGGFRANATSGDIGQVAAGRQCCPVLLLLFDIWTVHLEELRARRRASSRYAGPPFMPVRALIGLRL